MWLKKFFWYNVMFLKYVLITVLVTAVLSLVFPPAAMIVGGLMLIGSFGAAHKDLKEKIVPKLEYKNLKKKYGKISSEFEGFDEMLTTVQRGL